MTTPALPDAPADSTSPRPTPERGPWRVPATIWAWLLIFALITLSDLRGERRAGARSVEPITSQTFEAYVEAESNTRQAFGLRAASQNVPLAGAENKAFADAIAAYRAVLQSGTPAPNTARRLLIVAHAAGRPFDAQMADETLPRALRASGTKNPKDVQAETDLWRALYGAVPPKTAKNAPSRLRKIAAAALPAYAERIRQMRLRFLEDRALADLYAAAGDTRQARALNDRFQQKARGFFQLSIALVVAGLLAFVVGLVFLGIFAWTALGDKKWPRVGRVATQPQRMAWGDLLDAFVFYLAFYRGVGLLVGLALPVFVPDRARLDLAALIGLNAALQFSTGLAAVAYLVFRARRSGATLADVGFSQRGRPLLANVAYGVAGYVAALPLVIGLGKVSELIFRHFPDATPNPALTLLTSADGFGARFLIFATVAIGAPFFEEMFFRGALFTGLRTRFGWGLSAVLCALAFALVHPPVNWLPIFGLGYVLSTMREMRQSLVPCFVAHFLQNFLAFVALNLLLR